jgi:cyclopropane fatty-acyl-phospholipid synthase-like methyltransferase
MQSQINKNIELSYDNHSYERENSVMEEWKKTSRDKFLTLLLSENKNTILDIGAGHGRDSRFFMDNNIYVTAIDLSNEMVKLCRDKGIEAYRSSFFSLSWLNRKYDAIWAMNCLLHVEKASLGRVLFEIDSVLNDSGLFYMGVYGGDDSEGIWEEDKYVPKRFFSSFSDEGIKRKVAEYFDIVQFERIETSGKNHFQSLILRKKIL